ncbi:hypothetical protein BCV71DRAFT_83471 [Rhizopus microsporus]|uniref:Uncharacterized protein n=1 Tax=Rhizopus microsporus TaxID=58291 RepID=A0A1X0RKR3_RHIZD|nr:hypothetical protein BCV71DRAFT_83471 [Rhizopus microsporus]
MRVRLIERSDRRTHNLPTMGETVAATPVEYSDRGFGNVVRTLRSNSNLRQTLYLSSTFNISVKRMLHTCQHTMYFYFHMDHMGDIGACNFRCANYQH